jgi:hypothetical protein
MDLRAYPGQAAQCLPEPGDLRREGKEAGHRADKADIAEPDIARLLQDSRVAAGIAGPDIDRLLRRDSRVAEDSRAASDNRADNRGALGSRVGSPVAFAEPDNRRY